MEAVTKVMEEKLPSVVHAVLLDNDRVRVLDVRLGVGETSPMHTHLGPVIIYGLCDGQARFTFPDGHTEILPMKAGAVAWDERRTHQATNIGESEIRVLAVEIKE